MGDVNTAREIKATHRVLARLGGTEKAREYLRSVLTDWDGQDDNEEATSIGAELLKVASQGSGAAEWQDVRGRSVGALDLGGGDVDDEDDLDRMVGDMDENVMSDSSSDSSAM
jgi:hypothetical protein